MVGKKKKDKDDKDAEEENSSPEEEETSEADGDAGAGAADGAEDGEEGEDPKKGKKKKLILLVIILLALGGGGAAFMMFTGGGGNEESEEEILSKAQTVYLDLEEFLTNLNEPGRKSSFLKMKVTLELPNLKSQGEVENKMPRIRDSFQIYLRELRSSDLQGSAGLHRLREELLLRLNKILEEAQVTDVLFKEVVVQ